MCLVFFALSFTWSNGVKSRGWRDYFTLVGSRQRGRYDYPPSFEMMDTVLILRTFNKNRGLVFGISVLLWHTKRLLSTMPCTTEVISHSLRPKRTYACEIILPFPGIYQNCTFFHNMYHFWKVEKKCSNY